MRAIRYKRRNVQTILILEEKKTFQKGIKRCFQKKKRMDIKGKNDINTI